MPLYDTAHAQDDLNLHISCMLKDGVNLIFGWKNAF